jgi:hypothetical protein
MEEDKEKWGRRIWRMNRRMGSRREMVWMTTSTRIRSIYN